MDVLKKLFEQHFNSPVMQVQPLQGQLGGSGRNIIRLASEKLSAIGILYSVHEENVAFLEFTRHFLRHDLPMPEIYAEDNASAAPSRAPPHDSGPESFATSSLYRTFIDYLLPAWLAH